MSIETLLSLAGAIEPPDRRALDASQVSGEGGPAAVSASTSLENPRTPLTAIFDIAPSPSGVVVTEETAIGFLPIWRCVTLIAGYVAKTPFHVYRRTKDGKQQDPGHYLWPLLHLAANAELSAYRFRRLMQVWALMYGNAYAEIEQNERGEVIGLWPWHPRNVSISRMPNGERLYTYHLQEGGTVSLTCDYILHIRGLEMGGLTAINPIKSAARSIGLGMAAEEYGARFFGNSGKPGGWIEHPGKLGSEAKKNLREAMESIHRGLRGAHRIAIFEEGMKYHDVGVPPEDMQFLQTRQFQAIDIARLFGVPPHKIAELARATFSNIEHQALEFINDCLSDWFVNWQQECTMGLLSRREAAGVFLEFHTGDLAKGDMLTRFQAYNIARQGGWMNANQILAKEGENGIGPDGDVFLQPLNMQPLGATPGTTEPDPNDPQTSPAQIPADEDDPALTTPTASKSKKKRK